MRENTDIIEMLNILGYNCTLNGCWLIMERKGLIDCEHKVNINDYIKTFKMNDSLCKFFSNLYEFKYIKDIEFLNKIKRRQVKITELLST